MRNIFLIPLLILIFVCIGCTRKVYIPIERTEIRTDTLYKARWYTDTILSFDTIRIEKNGDTIRIKETKWRYHGKSKTDTIKEVKTDTIYKEVAKPYEVIKEKEVNVLYWWQKGLMWLGGVLLLIILYFLYNLIRYRR